MSRAEAATTGSDVPMLYLQANVGKIDYSEARAEAKRAALNTNAEELLGVKARTL